MHNPESAQENERHKLLCDFVIQTDHLIKPDQVIAPPPAKKKKNGKKRNFRIVDFANLSDHRGKLKESKKRDKYPNLVREMKKNKTKKNKQTKKLWSMKVTVILIVISVLGTDTKGLIQGLEDLEIERRVETTLTKALLRSARIRRKVLAIRGYLQSLKFQWKTIINNNKN